MIGPNDGRLLFTVDGNLPVTVFENASTRGSWLTAQEAAAFLTGCEIFLRRFRPDLVWTYGGDPVSLAVQRLAKHLRIPILFALHNFSYASREPFELAGCVTVPSEFSRRYHREKLGLECHVLPNIVNWQEADVRTHLAPRDAGKADGTRRLPATFADGIGSWLLVRLESLTYADGTRKRADGTRKRAGGREQVATGRGSAEGMTRGRGEREKGEPKDSS